MTREDAKKAAEIMLAYANGEEIESLFYGKYVSCEEPTFNWIGGKGVENYRIKPKEKFDPKTLKYDDRKCCEEDDRDPNFLPEQYHVKKEPSRPFHNAEECLNEMMKHQPFGWVYDKNNNQFLNTNRVGNDGVDFYGRQRNTFAKANSYITFADKEPFGIKG